MKRLAILLLVFSVTVSTAKENPPVVRMVDAPIDAVKAAAVAQATSNGFMLEQEGQFQFVFSRKMTGASGFLTNLLESPSACSSISPRWFVTVVFIPGAAGVRIQGISQYEHAGPLCQPVRENFDGKKPRQDIESFLQEIKATAEKSVQQQPVQAAQKKSPLTEEQRQLVLRNSRAAMSSPAAAASIAADSPKTPQELAQLIQEGQASRCGVTTSPPGAEVYIDGNKAGAAPLGFVLLKHGDTPRIITIKMQGYKSVERQYIPDGKIIPVAVILERESSAEVSGGHEQPPQNTPTVLADEPQYINSFYALDASGKLLELEHTRVAFHSKVRAVPGYASAKTSAEIKPGQSPVRLPANAQFILRGRSLMDPASRYELRLLKSSKSHREFALIHAHGSAFIFGASGGGSGVSEGAVPIQFEEYGRYSYRITPAQPLAPGEYALSVRGLVSEVYCFGVDQ